MVRGLTCDGRIQAIVFRGNFECHFTTVAHSHVADLGRVHVRQRLDILNDGNHVFILKRAAIQ